MESARITDNKGLADLLEDEGLCAGGITAIAMTSRPGTAMLLRAMADDREDEVHLVLHEAIDTETPSHPRAFTQVMATQTLAALRGAELWGDTLVFACDAGQSRSAAVAAAWARIRGLDDLEYWLDPRKYYPNVLVYTLMLEAAGFGYVAERAVLRKLIKEAVLAGAVQGGNNGDGPPLVSSEPNLSVATSPNPYPSVGITHLAHNACWDELSQREKELIRVLAECGPMGIGDIQNKTGCCASTAFATLGQLEDLGLIERGPNRFDRKLSHLGWDLLESRNSDKTESHEGEE